MGNRDMTSPVDVLEAMLFASDAPIEAERIQEVLELDSPAAARELVDTLGRRLDSEGRALQVIEVGGGFRLVTRPEVAPWLIKLQRSKTKSRLSRPALETLAIIAYRQPVSRPEVDAIRGVNSEGVLDNLLDRRMIRIGGRERAPRARRAGGSGVGPHRRRRAAAVSSGGAPVRAAAQAAGLREQPERPGRAARGGGPAPRGDGTALSGRAAGLRRRGPPPAHQ